MPFVFLSFDKFKKVSVFVWDVGKLFASFKSAGGLCFCFVAQICFRCEMLSTYKKVCYFVSKLGRGSHLLLLGGI